MTDDEQFALALYQGSVYIVEKAKKTPTKIRCQPFEKVKIQKGTMLDLGSMEIVTV